MSNKKTAAEMSFLDHLEELRWAILKSVLAILAFMIGCFLFSTEILNFLIAPDRLASLGIELQSFKPAGMFTIRINVSLVVGFAFALPLILYFFWRFVSPGLLENEKKYVPFVIFFSCLLFIAGAAFAFYVLIPVMVQFFIEIYIPGVKAIWDIGFYIGLINKMVLLMGLVFQMPMIVGFLTWIRVLSYEFLRSSWRYAIVIIFITAAVITPTGDPYTQTLVAIPLVVLYFISLGISWLIGRGRGEKPDDDDDPGTDLTEGQAVEQPVAPDSPTISRGNMRFMGPEAGMEYWPENDDEFVYDYEKEFDDQGEKTPPGETGESNTPVDNDSEDEESDEVKDSTTDSESDPTPEADDDKPEDNSDKRSPEDESGGKDKPPPPKPQN